MSERVHRGLPWRPLVGGGIAMNLLFVVAGCFFAPATGTPAPSSNVYNPTPTSSAGAHGSAPASMGPPPCEAGRSIEELLGPIDGAALCNELVVDGSADLVEYNGSPATVQPNIDITASGVFSIMLLPDLAARLAGMCGSGTLHCPGAAPAAGSYTVYVIEFAKLDAQLPDAFWEAGIGYFDQTISGGTPRAWEGAPADVLRGNNTIYTLRFPSSGQPIFGPFRLFYLGSGDQLFFREEPSGAFAYTSGSVMIGFIPSGEWDGARDYRFFSYYMKNDNSAGAVDEAPNFDQPPTLAPGILSVIDMAR